MKKLRSLFLIPFLALFIFACNKDDDNDVLTISGFSPASASAGTDVTIVGKKFDPTPANNIVKFGTVEATVKSAATEQLVVTVPSGATTGKISVTVNGQTVTSSTDFTLSSRTVVEVPAGDITANTSWTADKIYLLKGFVYVKAPAVLTIQAGTIIKGDKATKATLIIDAGAKIQAEGTATNPIVFTSNQPKGQRNYGDWGGIVIIGKGPHNRPGSQTYEGGITGTYGTDNVANDNSGVLKYVRIEFPGIPLTTSANSEINGLTLYKVGSGTIIDHIQVSYSGDDSYEWFGGTVNAKYLVAHRGFDDDFDTDFGYTGRVQFGVSLRDPSVADQSGSNGFESDNFNPGTSTSPLAPNAGLPLTEPIFANISIFATSSTPSSAPTAAPGSGPYQSGMHLRRNTATSIFNTVIVGYPEGLRLDGAATLANATAGTLDLKGIVLANMTTPVRGDRATGGVTDEQATAYFNATDRSNQIVTGANLGTLSLNAQTFNLTTPSYLPQTGSPLLQGAVWTGKGADAFFEKVTYKGAFGTTDWTTGWTNFDPQNTDYQ